MDDLQERLARTLAGRYRIERELGRGGMGVVFLAEDLRHRRRVALKVLHPEASAALGAQRFLREIQFAARLTHPHILPLLDSGDAEGQLFYTTPFLEGESLRGRLQRERQLPIEDALRIGREVADALAYAHGQGVLHRDIKPENILLCAGHAVVADFGIARALGGAGDRLTSSGVVLGTPAYASPEQGAGTVALDPRSDQYSLGCVVYEMLAGQPPFSAPTVAGLVYQHLSLTPRAVTELRPTVPPGVADALARALAKNPADRFADAGRFADALELPAERGGPTVGARAPARRRSWLPWIAVAAAVFALVAGAWWAWWRPRAPEEVALTRITFDSGATLNPAISPDGKLIAYASDRGGDSGLELWVQYVDARPARQITHDAAIDWQPSFSPDGARIAFRSERDGGGIFLISTLGGEERRIADQGCYPRFSPDGTWIAYMQAPAYTGDHSRMFLVSPDGGPPRAFQPDFRAYMLPGSIGPIWSPDGRSLLFYGQRVGQPESEDWWVAPVDGAAVRTGALRALGAVAPVQFPCLWLPSRVVFARGMTFQGVNLYRVSIDPSGHRVRGPAVPLTSGPGMKHYVSVSGDGRIVLSDMTWTVNLWTLDLDRASQLPIGAPRKISAETAPKFGLSTSRDGTLLAYTTYFGTPDRLRTEERVRDLVSGRETTVATSSQSLTTSLDARLNADGSLISYVDAVGGQLASFVLRRGETTGRRMGESGPLQGFFPGDRQALARVGRSRLARLDLSSGAQTLLVDAAPGVIVSADLSPDGRFVAAVVGNPADGSERAYVIPLHADLTSRTDWVAAVGEPFGPGTIRWAPDGSRIYFVSRRDGFGCLWAQRLDPVSKRPLGEPYAVVHLHGSGCMLYGAPSAAWSFGVTPNQIVFNAAEITGNIWQGRLAAK